MSCCHVERGYNFWNLIERTTNIYKKSALPSAMMRRVELAYDDDELFNTELSQPQYDFFQKHEAAFHRMYEEQGKEFWVRYVMTFRSFTNKYGYLKDFPHKKQLTYILDFAFIVVHEKFVDAKFKDTKNFIFDIVTIARHRSLVSYYETKKCMNGPRSKNPFLVKETRDVFRRLFGSQDDEQSYLKALLLVPLFLRFGGSVMICLRRWLEAPPLVAGDHSYWTPDTTHALKEKSSSSKKKRRRHYDANETSSKGDLRSDGLPKGDTVDTEDVLRFVDGDEATKALVAQQKRDKNKKQGKSNGALPMAEDGDLVALVVTVHKDGAIKCSGVVMETQPVMDGPKVTEVVDEADKVEDEIDEEVWNQMHETEKDHKDPMEDLFKNIEERALEAHEKSKRDADARRLLRLEKERAERAERAEKAEREKKAAEATTGDVGATGENCKDPMEELVKNLEAQALEAHEKSKRDADTIRLLRLEKERAERAEREKRAAEMSTGATGGQQECQQMAQQMTPQVAQQECGRNDLITAASNSVSKSKTSKKKRSGQSAAAATLHKPLDSVVQNGVVDGSCLMNGDVKIKGKLRECANCKLVEASPKMFKKCQKCKMQKVTCASYYCSRECQADDWVAVHKAFHKTLVQL